MPENSEEARSEQDVAIDDAELIGLFAGHGIDRDSAAHFRGRLERRLVIHRCDDCAHWHHPPRPMCPACWSWNITPTEVSGRGTIHLLMTLHQGVPAPGVDYAAGHPVLTVELDEQSALRFTATATPDFPADQLEIGTRVELDWIDRDGTPTPAFRIGTGA
ncbi:MAG: zinc ribbon domain-containing protein [Acidimicrobiales bacterium]|nr:zinc ribbon domain-containing protein [Acidimicrobiales bacterium]